MQRQTDNKKEAYRESLSKRFLIEKTTLEEGLQDIVFELKLNGKLEGTKL